MYPYIILVRKIIHILTVDNRYVDIEKDGEDVLACEGLLKLEDAYGSRRREIRQIERSAFRLPANAATNLSLNLLAFKLSVPHSVSHLQR